MSIPIGPTHLIKSPIPFLSRDCRLPAQIMDGAKPLVDPEGGGVFLVDLSGGSNVIEWSPALRVMHSMRAPFVERGLDSYTLRVWKRRHGVLVTSYSQDPYDPYTEDAYTDPWATWLDQHIDLRFLIADVEFRIDATESYRNGVNYWMNGRRVAK